MADDDTERKQIPLRVSQEKKENWEQYQEDLGYHSREAMIRRAVEYFHATKVGDGGDELAEEISAQMDDIKDRLDILRADVGDVRREQISQDDIDDVAQEVAYAVEGSSPMATIASSSDIRGKLVNAMSVSDPTDAELNIAEEMFLTGFHRAIAFVEDEEEEERLRQVFEEQHESLAGDFYDD